jgi:methyltransferase family protein
VNYIEKLRHAYDAREQITPGFGRALWTAPDSGLLMEFGVAGGTSFRSLCNIVAPRKVYGFDWFYGLPEYWNANNPQGKFSTDGVIPEVPENGVIVAGLVQNTLERFLKTVDGTVAFAHMDLDLYSSTKYVLDKLAPRCVPGTILLFDEIVDNPHHEERAFLEFLDENHFSFEFVTRRNHDAVAFRLV